MTDNAPRPLHLVAFTMNSPGHVIHGVWRRPTARQAEFNDLDHWVRLAKLLERGQFDAIFFGDIVGRNPPYRGDHRKIVEGGIQFPANDPSVLASALAYGTEHLGIAFTSSIVQEHPFNFARRMSTLDHATKGRIAWNIVTTPLVNAFRNFGFEGLVSHAERYEWADEYVDVVYKLWEGSWDDDALVQDRAAGIHATYEKVHRIDHDGPRYRVEGPHLVSPSPQRTPLLFQAGASEAGRNFAAKNAECVFIGAPTIDIAARQTADVRARAASFGRSPDDLKFFQWFHVVVGSTEAEAQRKSDELDEWIDYDGNFSMWAGAAGIEIGSVDDLDRPVDTIKTEAVQSVLATIQDAIPDRVATLRDVAELTTKFKRMVGTPEQIADKFAAWQAAGVDGFNLLDAELPASYEDFIDHVVPVLQDRGLAQREYRPGSLRHKLFGAGDRLPGTHPAARYRGAFVSTGA